MKRTDGFRIIKFATAIVACAVTLTVPARFAVAGDQTGGLPGDWLSRYSGARTAGIGGAFVATADEPIGAVWNPAGLSSIMQNEAHFEQTRLFEGTDVNALSFVVPARWFPTLGFTVLSLSSGDFQRTNELNQTLGTFKDGETAFLFSASKAINPRFALGANLKVIRQTVEQFDATGVGADVGLIVNVTNSLRAGLSLLNVGGPSLTLRQVAEDYPLEFRGGLAYRFFGGRGLVGAEVDHRSGPGAIYRTGTEVWLLNNVALRLGYDDNEPTGGFSYAFNDAMEFDYGMSNHELGIVQHFGFTYRFGGFFASSVAEPAVFSPLGEHSVTKFEMKSRTKAEAQSWQLAIRDKHDQVVRSFGGPGVPPAHVMWDGKDETGMTLPDGVYTYRLRVVDEEGRVVIAQERSVQITTAGPQGSVPVIIQGKN